MSIFTKVLLAVRSIKNFWLIPLDLLGLLKGDITYRSNCGVKTIVRGGTNDYSEIVIIHSDTEYPKKYYPLNNPSVVLDIGANVGSFTTYLISNLLNKGVLPIVYAIEPNKSNYELLKKNVSLNKYNNYVVPSRCAISKKEGTGYLIKENNNFDNLHLSLTRKKNSEEIKVFSLEGYCKINKIKHVDLLKMDIEGEEYCVLKSSIEFLKKNVLSLFVEAHNFDKKRNIRVLKQIFRKNNFEILFEVFNRTIFVRNLTFIKNEEYS